MAIEDFFTTAVTIVTPGVKADRYNEAAAEAIPDWDNPAAQTGTMGWLVQTSAEEFLEGRDATVTRQFDRDLAKLVDPQNRNTGKQTVITERFHLAKDSKDELQDDITINDHALTRPWTVTKTIAANARCCGRITSAPRTTITSLSARKTISSAGTAT